MEYLRILTDAEMSQAESQEGEILTASSPYASDTESEGEKLTEKERPEDPRQSAAVLKSHAPSGMHFSQERRKRTFTDMLQQNDHSSFTIPSLRQAFESAEESLVSLGEVPGLRTPIGLTVTPQNTFLHPSGKFNVNYIRQTPELNISEISEAPSLSPKVPTPEILKKFCDWNAIQRKHSTTTAVAMKALVASFVTSPPTSTWDFDPFKLPIKLAKNDVESYKRQISSRHCLRDLVKVVDKDNMLEVSHVSTVLSLIPLNAMAYNKFDGDISAEGMKMLAISSGIRKMVQSLNCRLNEIGPEQIYAALPNPNINKPARSRPPKPT